MRVARATPAAGTREPADRADGPQGRQGHGVDEYERAALPARRRARRPGASTPAAPASCRPASGSRRRAGSAIRAQRRHDDQRDRPRQQRALQSLFEAADRPDGGPATAPERHPANAGMAAASGDRRSSCLRRSPRAPRASGGASRGRRAPSRATPERTPRPPGTWRSCPRRGRRGSDRARSSRRRRPPAPRGVGVALDALPIGERQALAGAGVSLYRNEISASSTTSGR